MSKLEQASALIAELSVEEQAQILAGLVRLMNLTNIGIQHTPGVCGGKARIRNTRIPVWTIIEAKKSGATDIEILQHFESLTAEDLANALRYFEGHKGEIEQNLAEQHAVY